MEIKGYLNAPVPRWLALVAVASTGLASVGVTYFTMQKRYDELFQMRVAEEVANTTKFLNALQKVDYPTPQDAVEKLYPEKEQVVDLVVELEYAEDPTLFEVSKNVWTDAENWVLEAEIEKRDLTKPYILDYTEYFESDLQCVSVAYYEGDGVLADALNDEIIPDEDKIIGTENLKRFGSGSRDPSILYIHNPTYDVNYEVVKNAGSYHEQHYGFQHSDTQQGGNRRRVVRMRDFDDE